MSRKSLRKDCDRLWQQVITGLAFGRCAKCKLPVPVSGHHIISRRFIKLRYELCNGMPLCVRCHEWAHGHPSEFIMWMSSEYSMHYKWHNVNRHPPIDGPVGEEWYISQKAMLNRALRSVTR